MAAKRLTTLILPGQGTQVKGMGLSLMTHPVTRTAIERCSSVLDFDLNDMICNAPEVC